MLEVRCPVVDVSFETLYTQPTHRDHKQLRRTEGSHGDNDFLRSVDVDELPRRLIRERHASRNRCPVTTFGELDPGNRGIVEDIKICAVLYWEVEGAVA